MCITYLNIHSCGHTSYIDSPHLKALEITNYMDRPNAEKEANPKEVDENVLLTLLAEWRRKCIQESEEHGMRRNTKCVGCLEELKKRTGLTQYDEEPDEGNLVTRMELTGIKAEF